jgi:hypothetical protein
MGGAELRPAGSLATLVIVLSATAVLLRIVDEIPARMLGRSRGVLLLGSVAEAEVRLGQRLLVPAYFPVGLEWPPTAVHVTLAPPSACLDFRATGVRHRVLRLCQTLRGADVVPERLLPGVEPFHTMPVTLAGAPALLRTFRDEDASLWQDLDFHRDGSRVVLRFRGATERYMRVAASLRRSAS